MRAGVTFPEALQVIALGAVPGRCPNCHTHSMFRDFYTLYERCPNCGIKYERESGAWLGALVGSYAVGAVCVLVLGFVELLWHPFERIGIHPLATIIVISLVVTALAYRPSKGAWFALLWLYEFTDEPDEQPRPG